jgi:hypothetical protein
MAYLWDINGSSMGHQWLNPKEGLDCLILKKLYRSQAKYGIKLPLKS